MNIHTQEFQQILSTHKVIHTYEHYTPTIQRQRESWKQQREVTHYVQGILNNTNIYFSSETMEARN